MIREEADSVCLHDGHHVTLRRPFSWVRVPAALFVVDIGEEDACGALAGNIRKVDIEGESATKVSIVEEGRCHGVIDFVLGDESAVVMANPKALILGLEITTVKTLHVEVIPVAISSCDVLFFNVAGERQEISLIIILFAIIILAVNFDLESPERP